MVTVVLRHSHSTITIEQQSSADASAVTTVASGRTARSRDRDRDTRSSIARSLINPPSLHNSYFPCSCSFPDKVRV